MKYSCGPSVVDFTYCFGLQLPVLGSLVRDTRVHRILLLAMVGGICAAFLAWRLGFGPADLKVAWDVTQAFVEHHPWLLFGAILILPGLPVPISPIMLLAGAIFHEHPFLACLGCLIALELNLVWTYWLGRKPGRGFVRWMLERGKIDVPTVAPENEMKWLLIVRLTPGFPLFMQSYLLGYVGISFFRYLWVSLLCAGTIACGMVLTGAGVGNGRIGFILGGVGGLIVVAVVLKIIGARMGRNA